MCTLFKFYTTYEILFNSKLTVCKILLKNKFLQEPLSKNLLWIFSKQSDYNKYS